MTKQLGVVVASIFVLLYGARTPLPLPRTPVVPFDAKGVKRVVLVVLENGNPEVAASQPFMQYLAKTGMVLTRYYAVAHPSQPNYVTMISGSPDGAMTDSPVTLRRKHLGDILPAGSWRVYAEDYPARVGRCNLIKQGRGADRLYVRRHVPFLSFKDVQDGPCSAIVRLNTATDDVGALKADIAGGTLPPFSMIIPNLKHDGHAPFNITDANSWLMDKVMPLLQDHKFTDGTVFILTFDEDDTSRRRDNRVFTALWGDHVKSGSSADVYDHEDLLATISALLGVAPPPFDEKGVRPMGGIWK